MEAFWKEFRELKGRWEQQAKQSSDVLRRVVNVRLDGIASRGRGVSSALKEEGLYIDMLSSMMSLKDGFGFFQNEFVAFKNLKQKLLETSTPTGPLSIHDNSLIYSELSQLEQSLFFDLIQKSTILDDLERQSNRTTLLLYISVWETCPSLTTIKELTGLLHNELN